MQATIIYAISSEAQRAQMLATGQPVRVKHTVMEDVPTELLSSKLARISQDGAVTFDLTDHVNVGPGNYGSTRYLSPEFEKLPASATEAITQRLAEIETATADAKAEYAEYQETRRIQDEQSARIQRENDAAYAQRMAVDAAAEAAKETAKQAAIEAWIAEYADADMRQQHEDELLCRDTVIHLMAGAVLNPIGPKAEGFDTCDDRDCPCGSAWITCLPRSVYPAWRELRNKLPEGSTWRFDTVRACERETDEDGDAYGPGAASAKIYRVFVKVPFGPFTFERTVELG